MESEPDILDLLPWDYPFRMVDKMIACVPHRSVVTIKRVSANDPVAGGEVAHDARYFPSALLLEGLSQSAALLFRLSYGVDALFGVPMLGHLRATMTGGAGVGDTLEYTVTAIKMTSRGGIFAGAARVDGVAIVEAELGFGVVPR